MRNKKVRAEKIDRDTFLETDTQYEIVRPGDPEYPQQMDLIMRIKPPSSALLYDVFAHEYNKLAVGGYLDWTVPSFFSRSNIIRVLQGRGLAPDEYKMETRKDEGMQAQGIRRYRVRKLVLSSCRQRKNRGRVPNELRTGYKLAASMSLLHWMKARARKGESFYKVPGMENVEVSTAKVVVVKSQKEVTQLRRTLPLLDVGLPPAAPPEKKKDREYLEKVRKTGRSERLQPPEPAKPAAFSSSDGIEFG
jgi:hypothetical protein